MIDKFIKKDINGNWNTVPPVPSDKMRNVNCHKLILYIKGEISLNEMISDPNKVKEGFDFTYGEKALTISNKKFNFVENKNALHKLADKSCEIGELYIGQVLDAKTDEMAHSFIVTRETNDRYTYYDKQGFKYPFSSNKLGTLLDFVNKDNERPYQNQKWRFILIS